MRALGFALALLLAAVAAQAQTKKELAGKVVQLQQGGIESIGRTIAGRTSQQMLQAAGQRLQGVAADRREAVGRELQAEVKKFYDEIEPLLRKRATELATATLGATYEERFSEDELKQIIAWLESPTSRKLAQFDAEQGNALAERVVNDTRSTIEPKIRVLEAALARRLGLPPASAAAASAPRKK